jgi:hypothetical protein
VTCDAPNRRSDPLAATIAACPRYGKTSTIATCNSWVLLVALSALASAQSPGPRRGRPPGRVELADSATEVSLATPGDRPIVDVWINGRGPFKLGVETGNPSALTLYTDALRRLVPALPTRATTPFRMSTPYALADSRSAMSTLSSRVPRCFPRSSTVSSGWPHTLSFSSPSTGPAADCVSHAIHSLRRTTPTSYRSHRSDRSSEFRSHSGRTRVPSSSIRRAVFMGVSNV